MPAIIKGNQHMQVVTYTGNGGTQTINVGFKVGLVWIKRRDSAGNNGFFDVVRGATNWISSNATNAETAGVQGVIGFTSTGFTLGNHVDYNANGATYVAWCWRAGDSTVSNTTGTIPSQVCANPDAGFSITTWTYNSSGGKIGHGLGIAPQFIIQKDRTNGTYNWDVYHVSLGATQRLSINNTTAAQTYSGPWNNNTPTSSVFSSGASWYTNGDLMVSYCFAPIAGYSSFGSYTGNGSTDGPFIYTGFKPKFIMIKNYNAGSYSAGWEIIDTTRSTYNVVTHSLQADTSAAEFTYVTPADILSNGFKIRTVWDTINNASPILYAAFAENPFAYANAE